MDVERKDVAVYATGIRPDRGRHAYAALAALAAVLVYVNGLGNGFVFDDVVQVVRNYWITDPRHLGDIFSSGVWGYAGMPSSYYRPLMHVFYMAAWHLAGPGPLGFHLLNVIMHASASAAVYYLAAEITAGAGAETSVARLAAFCGALLFAVHPAHAEAVSWVAGLPDLLYSLFYILSLYAYVLSGEGTPNAGAYRLFSVLAFLLAALSKEPALTLPAVLAACDYAGGGFRRGYRETLIRYAPYLAVIAVYMMLRTNALGSFAPNTAQSGLGVMQAAMSVVTLLGSYLRMLVLPFGLSGFHEFRPVHGMLEPGFIAGIASVCVFALLAWLGAKGGRASAISASLIVVPLLPALYIPALSHSPFAERYLYLPTAGLSLAVALAVARAMSRSVHAGKVSIAAVMVVACVFAAGTLARNPVWRDNVSFWSDAAAKSPGSARPQNALGIALIEAGRPGDAARSFARAIELDPSFDEPYVNLGNYHNARGELETAETYYRKALETDEYDADALNNLGVVMARRGRLTEAVALFEKAVRADRHYADAYANLARAYGRLGMRDEERAALSMRDKVAGEAASRKESVMVGGKNGR